MTSIDQNRFLLPAWGFSLLLHGLAVVLAVIFAAQIKPVLKEEVFKWDVALVDAVSTESLPESAQPVAPQAHKQTGRDSALQIDTGDRVEPGCTASVGSYGPSRNPDGQTQ